MTEYKLDKNLGITNTVIIRLNTKSMEKERFMGMMTRPAVSTLPDGGKYWENEYEKFYLKAYVPATEIDGQALNYGFRAPLLLVFEEHRQSREEAVAFARERGLADIAAAADSGVCRSHTRCCTSSFSGS